NVCLEQCIPVSPSAPTLARIGSERDLLSRRQKRRQKTGSPYTRSGHRTIPPHEPSQSDLRDRSSDCCVGISYHSTQFHPFRAPRILNIACKRGVPLIVSCFTSRIVGYTGK